VAESVGKISQIGIDTAPSILSGLSEDLDLTIISQIFQGQSTKIYTLKNTNITNDMQIRSLRDLYGKTIGVSDAVSTKELEILRHFGLMDSHYRLLFGHEAEKKLITGEIDALFAADFSGLDSLLSTSRPRFHPRIDGLLELYSLDDFEVLPDDGFLDTLYHSAVVVDTQFMKENEETVKKFLYAMTKGWIECRDNFDLCLSELPSSNHNQKWELSHVLDLVWGVDPERKFGSIDEKRWDEMVLTLQRQASISGLPLSFYRKKKNTTLQEMVNSIPTHILIFFKVIEELVHSENRVDGLNYFSQSNDLKWCICNISEACLNPGEPFICRGDEKSKKKM